MTRRLLPFLLAAFPLGATASEQLSLATALKVAQAQNFTLARQRNSFEQDRLRFRDAFEQMWFPSVSVSGNFSSAYTLGQIPHSDASDSGEDKARGDPEAAVGINMGSYTIFNSFKDKLNYDITKLNYERSKQRLKETVRSVKSTVVETYFRARTEQDKLDASRRSLEMAEALLKLVKSRALLGKATSSDVSSAEVDVLNARNQVNNFVGSEQSARWSLNTLLRYPLDQQYVLSTELRYAPLHITTEKAFSAYETGAPSILDANLGLKSSETSLLLAQMNRLPLPTVSFSGIGARYVWRDSYYGTQFVTDTSGGSHSGNFDIMGGIMLTLPIVGPGGLFQQRDVNQAYLSKETSRLSLAETRLNDQSYIISSILTTRQQEKNIGNLKESLEKATKLLAALAGEMGKGRMSRLEMRDALTQARDTELTLKNEILYHLSSKLRLGTLIGSDQFLPEN